MTIKTKLITATVVLALLSLLLWAYNHSFVQFNVSGLPNKQPVNYKLTSQATHKSINFSSSSGNISRLVPQGSYNVAVVSAGKSYFGVVTTPHMLGKTQLSPTLLAESSRRYVGNNPAPCMNYLSAILISYTCGDLYSKITTHIPASATQPTYNLQKPNFDVVYGSIEGLVKTTEGSLILVHTPSGESSDEVHTINKINDDLKIIDKVTLANLRVGVSYKMTPYLTGFLVHSSSFDQVLYYSGMKASPVAIALNKPSSTQQLGSSLTVSGNNILLTYTGIDDEKTKKDVVNVSLWNGNNASAYVLPGNSSNITPCGTAKICAINNKVLTVYDVSGGKAQYLYQVTDVLDIRVSGSKVLIVKPSEIISFDIDKRSGYTDYSFGEYRFNNLVSDLSNYILSLIDSHGKNIALYINESTPDDSSIDKKIQALQRLNYISNISIYSKFIYITPELGVTTYNTATNSFGYDPAVRQAAASKLQQAIHEQDITSDKYTIINTNP